MNRFAWMLRAITLLGGITALAGILSFGAWSAAQTSGAAQQYMAPRFPSYLKPVKSVAELMPSARALVRNRTSVQGLGLGIVAEGQTIAIVTAADSEDMTMQAIKAALAERRVKALLVPDYELVGVSQQDALALRKALETGTAEKGYLEAAEWVRFGFATNAAEKWLRAQRPDLYAKLFPPQSAL